MPNPMLNKMKTITVDELVQLIDKNIEIVRNRNTYLAADVAPGVTNLKKVIAVARNTDGSITLSMHGNETAVVIGETVLYWSEAMTEQEWEDYFKDVTGTQGQQPT